MTKIVPVILAGGSGSRLWPLSRELHPKQFLPLVNSQSLLQNTFTNLDGIPNKARTLVLCNEQHRFIAAEQLRELNVLDQITLILEPVSRNTAPAIAIAALHTQQMYGDEAVLLVLSADHAIENSDLFCASINTAIPYAMQDYLVTFGIKPTHPETGYGYIQTKPIDNTHEAYYVDRFIEKPPLEKAEQFMQAGNYFWNSGIFMFKAKEILAELDRYAPTILNSAQQSLARAIQDKDFTYLNHEIFTTCPADSIDYAVMEKTNKTVVIPMQSAWNDVGSWAALWQIGEQDQDGNVTQGDVIAHQTKNCYVRAENRLVTTIGLSDCVIAETADAVLVAHKDHVQQVKHIVQQLKNNERSEAALHCTVHRPWGSYELIDEGKNFKVKRIVVKPGASLSLQMHHHRNEHWIVVDGTAEVTCGNETFLLKENASTYIPAGTQHRLSNPLPTELHLIEVQSGSYLGEDDIVRFEDHYGRVNSAARAKTT